MTQINDYMKHRKLPQVCHSDLYVLANAHCLYLPCLYGQSVGPRVLESCVHKQKSIPVKSL